MPLRSFVPVVLAAALVLAGACTAPDRGPPPPDPAISSGAEIASQWCAGCHGSGRTAPEFRQIAGRPGRDYMYLTNFMADLHLPMPTYRLWPKERSDVVQYILSLKPL